jgi:phenylalanyl-tRNA synthetase beta chain
MRVPVSWLRELVDADAPAQEIASRLFASGTHVHSIDRLGGIVSGVVVAEVLEVSDVPGSAKLCKARLDAGPHGLHQVVAGAKNFAAGDRLAYAIPGSRVTTLERAVGVRRLAGVESEGMVCSARELGVSDDHEGILRLDPSSPPGADVVRLLALDDEVLDLEIYPNRPDLMSVIGVAREVAVLFDAALRMPDTSLLEEAPEAASVTSVTVEDAVRCPRYVARVIENVSFAPSPALVQARLSACGFRPLGNLVDATNYALLLTGQPLHAFDLDRLEGKRIVVRRAAEGETLTTLDGSDIKLDTEDLVIADAARAQALAGVMGGRESEVGTGTRRVLLESAYFEPNGVARTSRRHHMRTEASSRFERGADPQAPPAAAALCAELLRRWAGGRVARGSAEAGGTPERRRITLRMSRIPRILGIEAESGVVARQLEGLGCEAGVRGGTIEAVAPSWRPDLEREIDLIEEVARLHGYDRIPAYQARGERGGLSREQLLRRRVREALLGAGLSEATISSLVSESDLELIGSPPAIRVSNPMTVDQAHLRPSLVPGLLRAAQRNVAHGVEAVRLFEIGTVFGEWAQPEPIPDQWQHVAAILSGQAGREWHGAPRPVDAYDAKGVIEVLAAELSVPWEPGTCDAEPFHPGRSASVLVSGREVGRFGEVRPSVARALDLTGGTVIVELDLGSLIEATPRSMRVAELPRFPAVGRDIALVVDEAIAAAEVERVIRESAGDLLESVSVVDVYTGQQIPAGRKSLAWRLTLRAPDRTLTAREGDSVREAVASALLERLGAEIR